MYKTIIITLASLTFGTYAIASGMSLKGATKLECLYTEIYNIQEKKTVKLEKKNRQSATFKIRDNGKILLGMGGAFVEVQIDPNMQKNRTLYVEKIEGRLHTLGLNLSKKIAETQGAPVVPGMLMIQEKAGEGFQLSGICMVQ